MPTVLIQIGLSGGRPRDYEYRAQFMERSGWKTELTGSDGKTHPLTAGIYVGPHDSPAKLAADLQADIRASGLDDKPTVLTAIISDWAVIS